MEAKLSRRQFARLALGGMAASLLGGCAVPNTSQAPVTTTVPAGPLAGPSPVAQRQMLRNENIPGFYARYYRPFEAVDRNRWTLNIEGLVRNRQTLSLASVLALPRRTQTSRMKCVECWSAAAKWEGFHLSSLLELVQPAPNAKWVYMDCADGYYEAMSIEGLLRERVLFVHHMNDQLLPDIYGAPLRLMVPSLYGYKSAKAIVRIEFGEQEGKGYWSTAGPYTSHGTIRRGFDHPLDLEGSREVEGSREIIYPDGIESREQGET